MDEEDESKNRMQELFGSSESDDSEDGGDDDQAPAEGTGKDVGGEDGEDGGESDDEMPPKVLQVPHLTSFPSETSKTRSFFKMINVLRFDTRPYDRATLKEELENTSDGQGGTKRLRLNAENVIRWKLQENEETGEVQRVSNGRLVKWSDGSMQMHVGKQVFEVSAQDVSSQNFHTYVRHQGIMRCQGRLGRKLMLTPLQSSRSLTAAIAENTARTGGMNIIMAKIDPEVEKRQLEEAERRKIVEAERQRRRQATRGMGRGYSSNRVEESFLEEYDDEEDDGDISLAAVKDGASRRNIDDEDADRRIARAKASRRRKRFSDSDDDSDDGMLTLGGDEDEDEDEAVATDDDDNDSDQDGNTKDGASDEETSPKGTAPVASFIDDDEDDEDEEAVRAVAVRRGTSGRKAGFIDDDDDDEELAEENIVSGEDREENGVDKREENNNGEDADTVAAAAAGEED